MNTSTINYGSLLCVKIKSIKNEYPEDYTMSLPLQILSVLNADMSKIDVRVNSNINLRTL